MKCYYFKYFVLSLIIFTVAVRSVIGDESQNTTPESGNHNGSSTNPTTKSWKKSFKEEEKAIFDFVNLIMRRLMQQAMQGASSQLSPRCTAAMMRVIGGLRKLDSWTLKLLDSMGKPTAGILFGTPYSPANFDQCLNISITGKGEPVTEGQEEFFHGQYCRFRVEMTETIAKTFMDFKNHKRNITDLGRLKGMIRSITYIPFMEYPLTHFLGVCLPSACTDKDINNIVGTIPVPAKIQLDYCTAKPNLDVDISKRIILGVLFFLLLVIFIGTAVDKLVHILAEGNLNAYLERRCISIAISFSALSNTKELLKRIKNDESDLPNFKGVRGLVVGTIFCLIVYNTYLPPFDAFYIQASSLSNLESYLQKGFFSIIIALPIVIETLFLASGFYLTNKIWKSTWKNGKKEVCIIQIIVESYFRLCLPLLLCIAIVIILPLKGFGPFWRDVFGSTDQNCQMYWWRYLAMINNFFDKDDQCLPHFWFVPCLMQLIFVSTIILYISSKCKKLGLFLFLCLVLGSHIAVGVLTYINEYPPAYVAYFFHKTSDNFWKINEALPLNHAGSFVIGMAMGILATRKPPIKLKFFTCLTGWILSLGFMAGICFTLIHYNYEPNSVWKTGAAIYAAVHKPCFALAICWILYYSSHKNYGIIGNILSWSVFDPLFKMSYFAYLFHLVIIAFHVATAREHFAYSHMNVIMRSLSYICLSYGLSYIACMVIDYPLKSLRKNLFASSFRQIHITYLNKKSVNIPQHNLATIDKEFNGYITDSEYSPKNNEKEFNGCITATELKSKYNEKEFNGCVADIEENSESNKKTYDGGTGDPKENLEMNAHNSLATLQR